MQTERLTKYTDASDTEKRLSKAVADELGIDPTYTSDDGREWPIVQCVDEYGNDYAFWLDEYGAIGTIGEDGEEWSTAHAEDGAMIEGGFAHVRDAALAAQYLEDEVSADE